MNATPIKKTASDRASSSQLQRTIANELPQELSQLPQSYGFSSVRSSLKDDRRATPGNNWGQTWRPKKTAFATQARQPTAAVVMDDGHPTILAAARDIRPN